jgi:D-apionolactonase
MSARERRALYGCDEPLPQRLKLRAGPLSFELVGGRFGPVHAHGHEVWHGLAFLFRDAAWGTPEPVFEVLDHQIEGVGFALSLRGRMACDPQDVVGAPVEGAGIRLDLQVRGDPDGGLHFQAQATPSHDLWSNRCGWVLLHPMSAAGCAMQVQHVDGRTSVSSLPHEVPAWPPFTAVRALRHEYAPGHWAQAQLPGEDYELEDQRNNADASFKTYSRSNSMPRPYVLRQGQPWTRELHLCLLGPPPDPPTEVSPSALQLRWPGSLTHGASPNLRLGLAITPDMTRAPAAWVLAVLAQWRPAFLHLTLWPDTPNAAVDGTGLRRLLQAAGASLRLDLCGREGLGDGGTPDADCRALAQQLALAGVVPMSVAALPCGVQAARFLRSLFPGSAIGGGTPHFFAQLNRLELSGGEDFMGFTVCPTVHGADDDSVMQGLQSLPSLLETARRRHPERDWHLGPSRLSARASPLGRQPHSDGKRRMALASRDPRSRGLFGAAWLLGHLAEAAQAGVKALSLPPLVGEDALFWPRDDTWQMTPSAALLQVCLRWQCLHPVVLQAADEPCTAAQGRGVAAVTGHNGQCWQMVLANLGAQAKTLGGSPEASWAKWACLDAESWLHFLDTPSSSPWRELGDCPVSWVLPPYGLVRIDLPFLPGG